MPEEEILNRRLMAGGKYVYPITNYSNVIGLQGTIKEKLPIVSAFEPQTGFVNRQAWIDISGDQNATLRELSSTPTGTQAVSFGSGAGQLLQNQPRVNVSFGSSSNNNQQVNFGNPNVNQE